MRGRSSSCWHFRLSSEAERTVIQQRRRNPHSIQHQAQSPRFSLLRPCFCTALLLPSQARDGSVSAHPTSPKCPSERAVRHAARMAPNQTFKRKGRGPRRLRENVEAQWLEAYSRDAFLLLDGPVLCAAQVRSGQVSLRVSEGQSSHQTQLHKCPFFSTTADVPASTLPHQALSLSWSQLLYCLTPSSAC